MRVTTKSLENEETRITENCNVEAEKYLGYANTVKIPEYLQYIICP
jgi:hypothetical protein